MELKPPSGGTDARRGFWAAAVIAALYLATAYANPVVGVVYALVFAVAAWGIRRGQAWAAIAAATILIAPVVSAIFRATSTKVQISAESISTAIGVLLLLLVVLLLLRAAKEMWRGPKFSLWMVFMAVVFAGFFCYRPFVSPTASMEDTILPGDQMLVNTLQRQPRRGEVVVFEYPIDRKSIFVKRVVAVAGDRVHLEEKKLFVNGAAVDEPYACHKTTIIDYFRDNFPRAPNVRIFAPAEAMLKNNFREGDIVVPEGKYFVLGDNRDFSLDSRYWGFIDSNDIIGRPALIYASFDTAYGMPANIFTTRWNRLLHRL
jgi:signal peptidase I